MEVDNIEKILNLLKFKENIYYFIQIIKRKKDNSEMKKSEIKICSKFVTSEEYLKDIYPEIKLLCNFYNARAYISITPRSLEKLGKQCLIELSKRVGDCNWNRIYSIPDKIAITKDTIKSRGIIDKPRWIIDIDSNDYSYTHFLINFLSKFTTINETLKTINGYHLVVDSFNYKLLDKYLKSDNNFEITENNENKYSFSLMKDGLTILYSNINKH